MLKFHLKLTKTIGRDQKRSALWQTEGGEENREKEDRN